MIRCIDLFISLPFLGKLCTGKSIEWDVGEGERIIDK